VAANSARAIEVLRQHRGADLALFPELFLTGYQLTGPEALAREAQTRIADIQDAARAVGTAVIVGSPWLVQGGVTNAAVCISATGELAGRYDKTHLFGREPDAFQPGSDLVMVTMGGVRIAPLICFDLEFPAPARALALSGAELLVVISANMRPYHRDHRVFCEARALENRLPLAYVNRVGRESGFAFVGGSRLVGADGRTRNQMGRREEVAIASLTLSEAIPADVDYLKQTRDMKVRS
jgi:predicted amidohydrolase